jgi:hypothetical protein
VATELYGVIEAVLVDEIRPAIEYLEEPRSRSHRLDSPEGDSPRALR